MANGTLESGSSQNALDSLAQDVCAATATRNDEAARAVHTRDSLDGIDPELAALARGVRRISTVPAIAVPRELLAPRREVKRPTRDLAAYPSASRIDLTLRWVMAAALSGVIGGSIGWVTRPNSAQRSISSSIAPRAANDALGSRAARVIDRPPVAAPAVRNDHVAMVDHVVDRILGPSDQAHAPVAMMADTSAQAAADEEGPSAPDSTVAPETASRRHRRAMSASPRAAVQQMTPWEAALAATGLPAQPAGVSTGHVLARGRNEVASNPARVDACSARCGGDLTCAAACVVRGSHQPEPDRLTPPVSVHNPSSETAPPAAVAPHDAEPAGPDRARVEAAIASVRSAVRNCVSGEDLGTAFVTITFASSGRVTTANTEAPYAGTPAGSCMARAVRQATLPPFARPTFRVRAPF